MVAPQAGQKREEGSICLPQCEQNMASPEDSILPQSGGCSIEILSD